MRTISQVANLTGISPRTLQYYDEIGLLKPSELTQSGYRLYDDEAEVARLAIKQFGSIEKYTEAMKHNLEHFSKLMDDWQSQIPEEMKADDKFLKLASHRGEDVASDSIQNLVKEIIAYARGNAPSELIGDDRQYCNMIIELYSNDHLRAVIDTKYGTGSCDYIVEAFRTYLCKSASTTL